VTATVDGRAVEPRAGETILEAAERLGVRIPALCRVPGLSLEGGCRLCLVEIEGRPALHAACHTRLADGAAVRTRSERLDALRREILRLVLFESGAALRADPAGAEFERLLAELGVDAAPSAPPAAPAIDATHPYLRFDRARCITCRRCVHACDEVQGRFVYAIEGRGARARLVFGLSERFAESDCVACGACVEVCPTGALRDRDRMEAEAAERRVRSTCGYCGVGCQVEVETAAGSVLRVRGAGDASVNRGHLCVKGRYAHAWQRAPDRLVRPLLREGAPRARRARGGALREASWEEAIRFAAARLDEIHRRSGPRALGVMTSSRSTNEAAYLLQKLFRVRFGTNHVDCCARVCHASTAQALRKLTGTGAATASYADIERARLLVVAGANPTEAHPVVGARLARRAAAGVPLVTMDPRRIELADWATLHLQLRPGTNVPLFNALAKVLVEEGRFDAGYVRERCEGFEELAAFLRGQSLEEAAAITGVAAPSIVATARLLGDAGPALFVHGLGLSELTQGVGSVEAWCNLAMLTGAVGRPGAGLLPLRGQNNVQGNADMGSAPDLVTGYQPVADPGVRARVAAVWGAPPPEAPGYTIPEMLEAAARGEVRALWIQGEDVAQSDPCEGEVRAALERLELLVVQELFLSETGRYAHLVLPAAGALEQDGTFTNAERRIQRVRAAVLPPGEARPDWVVACDLARALGCDFRYASPAEVMDEIARVAPALFGGVAYDRLEGDGLQWPCPTREHAGTATVHADGFLRGRGRLSTVRYVPSPESAVPGFPLTLVTGRVLDHYNVGTMTRRTPSLALAPEDLLDVHPRDAAAAGVRDGERVAIESRWGRTEARARLSERVTPGTLFLSFHFPETHCNALTGPQRDPESNCPEYKLTAVRLCPASRP
jgi:formate dehydrogenase alpha subunit